MRAGHCAGPRHLSHLRAPTRRTAISIALPLSLSLYQLRAGYLTKISSGTTALAIIQPIANDSAPSARFTTLMAP